MKRNQRTRRSAFTLLEILLVVGILALLAALVAPNLMKMGDQAKNDIAKSQVGRNGNIGRSLQKYRMDVGVYPETDEGLEALFTIPSSVDEESGKWKGPYLEGTPEELKDPWTGEFQYRSPGEFNEDSYDLWSNGPDGKDGTDDDIKNWREK
ncbi:MAG: type II secretion system major pseudopilin GspG [Phycisphaerae bacterium]